MQPPPSPPPRSRRLVTALASPSPPSPPPSAPSHASAERTRRERKAGAPGYAAGASFTGASFTRTDGKNGPLLRLVNRISFRLLVVSIITLSTIVTAVDGPFVSAEFGRGFEAKSIRLLNQIFGVAFVIEGALKLVCIPMGTRHAYTHIHTHPPSLSPIAVRDGVLGLLWQRPQLV